MLDTVFQVLVSLVLWSLTFGWYQLPINFLFLVIILRFVARVHIVTSVMVSFYAALVTLVIIMLFGIGMTLGQFVEISYVPTPGYACIFLSLFYAALQTFFCMIIKKWHKMRMSVVGLAILVSNSLAGLFTYWLLPVL